MTIKLTLRKINLCWLQPHYRVKNLVPQLHKQYPHPQRPRVLPQPEYHVNINTYLTNVAIYHIYLSALDLEHIQGQLYPAQPQFWQLGHMWRSHVQITM